MVARDIPEPPLPLSLLADLHGDNLPDDVQQRLRPVVHHDVPAQRAIDALDRVQADLRSLGTGDDAPPMPADVSARLHAAIAAADAERTAAEGTVVPLTRPARSRPGRWALGAAAAVIALFALAAGVLLLRPAGDPAPQAAPATTVDLPPALMLAAVGRSEVHGSLAEPDAMQRCLAAAGVDRPLLGSMSTTLHGRDAVVLVVSGGQPGRLTALAVGTGCAPGDPQVLARREIG